MAEQDYAVLVGISRYGVEDFLGKLDGPPNDVTRMKDWLTARNGGDVPEANIFVNTSPEPFDGADSRQWKPTEADYISVYKSVTQDTQGKAIKREGRLYLYFSGHGFSERRDQFTQAALFAANATKLYPDNICGTFFANVARDKGFFREVVLIMDCCRDSELSYPFSRPAVNTSSDDALAKILAVYAVPKGRQALEREIPELEGKTYGILTHALLQALTLAPADQPGRVSASAIKEYMRANWATARGETEAPEPQIMLPLWDDIYFNSETGLVKQVFTLPPVEARVPAQGNGSASAAGSVKIELFDARRRKVGTVDIENYRRAPAATLGWEGNVPEPLVVTNDYFELRLPDTLYSYVATGAIVKSGTFRAGEKNVDL